MKEGVSVALANEALRVETMANTTFLVAKFAVEVAQFPTAEKLLVACIIVDEAIRGKQVRFPCCFHAVFMPFSSRFYAVFVLKVMMNLIVYEARSRSVAAGDPVRSQPFRAFGRI